jgi:hypothetical protein
MTDGTATAAAAAAVAAGLTESGSFFQLVAGELCSCTDMWLAVVVHKFLVTAAMMSST